MYFILTPVQYGFIIQGSGKIRANPLTIHRFKIMLPDE